MIVDGVEYDTAAVRRLVHERHQLASEIRGLRERLRQADVHLRLRTAALARLIARKGPRLN